MTALEGNGPATAVADPLDDPVRLRAVHRLLATGARSEGLDRLTALAARLLNAPSAQVSLLSEQQFLASLGGEQPYETARTGPRETSLCTITARGQGPLAIADAAQDHRVRTLPPVTSGAVGAYLGVPLVDGAGLLLGALCVHDEVPRSWSPEHVGTLGELASAVVAELELRAVTLEVATSAAQLDLALSAADIGSFDWDLTTDELHWDDRLLTLFGYDRVSFRPHISSFSDRIHPDDAAGLDQVIQRALSTGEYSADHRIVLPDGEVRWVEARGKVLRGGPGRSDRMLGAAYDATARHLVQAQRESSYREREQAVVERERAYARAEAATHRLAVLADATTQLSASLEPGEVLETLAGVLVPALGRWMAVAAPAEQAAALIPAADPRQVQAVFVRHGDGGQQEALDRFLKDLPFSLDDVHGPGAVIRTGVTELLPQVTEQVVCTFAFDEDDVSRALDLQVGTALTVPMVSRGRRIAALTVAEPASGPLDQALLQDLAGRAAVALTTRWPTGPSVAPASRSSAACCPATSPACPGSRWPPGTCPAPTAPSSAVTGTRASRSRTGWCWPWATSWGTACAAPRGWGSCAPSSPPLPSRGTCRGSCCGGWPATATACSTWSSRPCWSPATTRPPACSPSPPPATRRRCSRRRVRNRCSSTSSQARRWARCSVTTTRCRSRCRRATLLLYTDGLVENRSESLSYGLERLRQALRDLQLPPEQVADHVLEVTGRVEGGDDDVALLVVTRTVTA